MTYEMIIDKCSKITNFIKKNQKYPDFLEVLQINLGFMFIKKNCMKLYRLLKKKDRMNGIKF